MSRMLIGGRAVLAGLALTLAGSAVGAPPSEIDGFSSPEAVTTDGKYVYVSNVGEKLDPAAKDGDGFISKLGKDGSVIDRRFLPKDGVLHAPKGMAVKDGVLYVADIDRVVGFDLSDGAQVYVADLSTQGTGFLNDMAFGERGTLYVSATDAGKIFALDTADKNSKPAALLLPSLPGPNGLKYDASTKRLLVASFGVDNKPNGEIGAVTQLDSKPAYRKLSDATGYFDGIALIGRDKVLTSDWVAFEKKGLLKTVDLRTGAISDYLGETKFGGPAAFLVDHTSGKVWLPTMMEGKIKVVPLPQAN